MKCSIAWTMTVIFCLTLVGCKSEDPNPELLDPIYKELLSTSADFQKRLEEEKAHLKELRESIEKGEPNSIDLAKARLDLIKTLRNLRVVEQKANYYRIRAERRRVEDRAAYKVAFQQGKEWPDHSEYAAYQVNRRLQEAHPNWNKRVPKLADRTSASVAAEKPKPAASGGGH